MTRQLEMTALQEHVLRYLAGRGFADPPDGPRLKAGATVREIADGSQGLYDARQVTQCVRALANATSGNADHVSRRAWTRAINPAGGSTKRDDVQWVATPAGRCMTGVRTLADGATTTCSDPPVDDRPPQRTWLTPGDAFTGSGDRTRVSDAIAALTWHTRTDDLIVPAMAGHAIANAARQLGLPPITRVAFDGALEYPDGGDTATYALYGVQCAYPRHGPARLYLLDTGTSIVTLAHDTWPNAPETARSGT